MIHYYGVEQWVKLFFLQQLCNPLKRLLHLFHLLLHLLCILLLLPRIEASCSQNTRLKDIL